MTTGFPTLFSPIELGGVHIKNRIAMAPMTNGYTNPDDSVSPRTINYYEARAHGGTGLIIVEGAYTHRSGRGWSHHLSVSDDSLLPGYNALVNRIHAAGAKTFLQLMHCGARARASYVGEQPVAPSAVPDALRREVPWELTVPDIKEIIEGFARAARRARDAGFDGIELHGANGYIIHQFWSPRTNWRTDEYGGNFEGRLRFVLEIIQAARDLVGPDFPISCRINTADYLAGGMDLDLAKRIARRLEQAGVAAIHISVSTNASSACAPFTTGMGEATLMEHSAAIKSVVSVPVILVGRIVDPHTAERVLREGKADLVTMGRGLLADPEFANKAASGHVEDIIPCVGCNGCQMRRVGGGITCMLNPATGREGRFPISLAKKSRRVLVLGCGLGALEASRVLALRGHLVTLATLGRPIGGLLAIRARVPQNEELAKVVDYFSHQIGKLGVEVVAEPVGVAELVSKTTAEVLIDARPGKAVLPNVGHDGVLSSEEVILPSAGDDRLGKSVLIIGAGLLGGETALALAHRDKRVVMVEEGPDILQDTHPQIAYRLGERLRPFRIPIYTHSKPQRFHDGSLTAVDAGEEITLGPFDSIVSALGWESAQTDLEPLKNEIEVHTLGDCYDAASGTMLCYEASSLGRKI